MRILFWLLHMAFIVRRLTTIILSVCNRIFNFFLNNKFFIEVQENGIKETGIQLSFIIVSSSQLFSGHLVCFL